MGHREEIELLAERVSELEDAVGALTRNDRCDKYQQETIEDPMLRALAKREAKITALKEENSNIIKMYNDSQKELTDLYRSQQGSPEEGEPSFDEIRSMARALFKALHNLPPGESFINVPPKHNEGWMRAARVALNWRRR